MKKLWSLVLVLALMTMGAAALAEAAADEPAADETSATEAPATEPEDTGMGIWELKAYVDEFDMPTDNYFILSDVVTGKFSNSATTDSELLALIFYHGDDYFKFRLLEYGSQFLNNPYSDYKDYDILMMDGKGEKHSLEGSISPKSEGIHVIDEDHILRQALLDGGTVRFAITESDRPMTKYIFSFEDVSGFDKALEAYGE